jgi:polar amino acid transport system substrate-binding protein
MQRGLVDAVVADVIILAGLRARVPNPDEYVIIGDSLGGGDYAIGLRENDSKWRDAINFALQDMWKDGAWDKIFDHWVGPNSALKLTKDEIGFKMEVWE